MVPPKKKRLDAGFFFRIFAQTVASLHPFVSIYRRRRICTAVSPSGILPVLRQQKIKPPNFPNFSKVKKY